MSPIKGLSDIRRFPRRGKVRLGIKVEKPGKHPYPSPTDYFVVPDDIKQYVGDKPKSLEIMFPSDNPEDFAPQYLKCYSMTQGLVCRGDGTQCRRKVDMNTGAVADHTTEEWEFKVMTCDPDTCPEFVGDEEQHIRPQCRKVMNLMFIMPNVPGLGVWQLDTSSFYSIVNINSFLAVIRGLTKRAFPPDGRIAGIPLTLSLGPQEVTPPGVKKKTVQILHLDAPKMKFADLRRPPALAPGATVAKPEEEEPPDDLFPAEILAEQEGLSASPPAIQSPQQTSLKVKPQAEWDKVTEDMVPDYLHLETLFCQLSGMSNRQMYAELGGGSRDTMSIPAWQAFLALKERFAPSSQPAQPSFM